MDKKEKRKKKKEAKQHGVMRVVYMCNDKKKTFHIYTFNNYKYKKS